MKPFLSLYITVSLFCLFTNIRFTEALQPNMYSWQQIIGPSLLLFWECQADIFFQF